VAVIFRKASDMKATVLLLGAALIAIVGCQSTPEAPRWVRIFDGRTAAGWDGDMENTWRIQDGAFVGGSLETNVPRNEFVATTTQYTNFVLRLEFKLLGNEGFVNAGVQVRSQRIPNHNEMIGYQVDIGDPNWWGSIYDESRRNKVLAQSNMEAVNRVLRRGDWNQYEIRCEGKRIRAYINGVMTVDYTEPDDSIPQFGKIGMQVHGGGKAEVHYREIFVRELP
jgi:hypothetical protein